MKELSLENKWIIYNNYLHIQSRLIHEPLEIDVHTHTEKHFGKNYKNLVKYPILLPNKMYVKSGFNNYRDFESFCNEEDSRVSEGLKGHYRRFKENIKLI